MEAPRRIQRLPPRSFLGSLCFAKDASLLPRPTKFRSASLRGICKEERTHCIVGTRECVPLNTEPLGQGLAEGAQVFRGGSGRWGVRGRRGRAGLGCCSGLVTGLASVWVITPAHWSWTDPASSELPIPTVLRLFPVVSSGSLRVPFFGPSNVLVVPSISSRTGPAIAHKTLCPTGALFLVTCTSRSWTYTLTPSFAINVVHGCFDFAK